MDQELDDIASAIPIALAKNGQNVPTANLPMGGFRHINVGAPTSVNNYMRSREFIENVPIFMDDTATSVDRISVSAQYFTSVSANQAPGDGTRILVRVLSNKSSAALYLNGHSANVEFQDGNRAAAAMVSGGIYEMLYSSVDVAWKLTRPDDGRTSAEISAGVTPISYQYPEGDSRRYNVTGNGTTDDTAAIGNWLLVGVASGRPLRLSGTPLISSTIIIPANVTIIFDGTPGNFSGQLPTSYFIKAASMTTAALLISGQSVKLVNGGVIAQNGNTGDNIHITGHSVRWEHAYSSGAGRDGIRIGEDAAGVPNSNHFVLIAPCSVSNGRYGININDAPGDGPNANAGLIQAPFLTSNASHGLYGHNSFGNTIIGILSESNAGKGVYLDTQAVGWLFLGGDIETNTSAAGTPGSDIEIAASVIAAGGQKGHNTFIGVNVGTPPTDNGYCTGRGWQGFPGFSTLSGPGDINAEGTCTLTFAGTVTAGTNTYSQQFGRWTKNGRQVSVHFDLEVSGNSVAMVGNLRISGLPFSGTTQSGGIALSLVSNITFPSASYTSLAGAINGTNFDLYGYGSGVAFSAIPVANLGAATGRLSGCITYLTPDS